MSKNYLPKVKEQYENLPYPPRNPRDERHRLLPPACANLKNINHYLYSGSQDFSNNYKGGCPR